MAGIAGDSEYENAVLLIISDANINALLQAPLTTKLLDNRMDTDTIDYSAWDSATPQAVMLAVTTSDPTAVSARGSSNATSGMHHVRPIEGDDEATARLGNTNVYIDNHAPVVLGYEIFGDSLELTIIGASFSRMPDTFDVFSGTYSGYAVATRNVSSDTFLPSGAGGNFRMNVEFDMSDMSSSITNFTANLMGNGMVEAAGIPIDNDSGIFSSIDSSGNRITGSSVTFAPAGAGGAGTIDAAGDGTFFGQFHGTGATGVTGAFYNSTDPVATPPTVLGGFAGSKE